MTLSKKAQDALIRIRALRQMPDCPTVVRAEAKILEALTLREVSDVALILEWDAQYDNQRDCRVSIANLDEVKDFTPSLLDGEVSRG